MIKLWVWRSGRSTTVGDDMNATRRAQTHLEYQQATETHNPATECACGTWRTPGMSHTKGDTGPAPSHKIEWCTR